MVATGGEGARAAGSTVLSDAGDGEGEGRADGRRARGASGKHSLHSVKVNCVVIRGMNSDPEQLAAVARLAEERSLDVRFIECMPFEGNGWRQDSLVGQEEILEGLREQLPGLELDRHAAHGDHRRSSSDEAAS